MPDEAENIIPEFNPNTVLINAADPNIRDIFANDVFVDIGESEIALTFSYDFYVNGAKTAKPIVDKLRFLTTCKDRHTSSSRSIFCDFSGPLAGGYGDTPR